jgi:hypothetical protein
MGNSHCSWDSRSIVACKVATDYEDIGIESWLPRLCYFQGWKCGFRVSYTIDRGTVFAHGFLVFCFFFFCLGFSSLFFFVVLRT